MAVGGRAYDIEKFKGIGRMMAINNPDIQSCDLKSLTKAVLNCAKFQLYPDGHYAHILTRNQKGSKFKQAQLIIDYKGILELLRRNGVQAEAKMVCENDEIEVIEDDGDGKTKVIHKVNYKSPRGAVVFVYSRAVIERDDSRTISYDIMTMEEIQAIKNRSPAGNHGPWVTDFNEMAKKTVIRRHSKTLPLDSTTLINLSMDDDRPKEIQRPAMDAAPVFTELEPASEPVKQVEPPAKPTPEATTPAPAEKPQVLSWLEWKKRYDNSAFVQKHDLYCTEEREPILKKYHLQGITPAKTAKAILAQEEASTQASEPTPEPTTQEPEPAKPDLVNAIEARCDELVIDVRNLLRFAANVDSEKSGMDVVYNSISAMTQESQAQLLDLLQNPSEEILNAINGSDL